MKTITLTPVSMDFPDLGIRITGSEASVDKKQRIVYEVTASYVAFKQLSTQQQQIWELLNQAACSCDTERAIEMSNLLTQFKKGVADFEKAFGGLYEASIEEEIPNECFDQRLDDIL